MAPRNGWTPLSSARTAISGRPRKEYGCRGAGATSSPSRRRAAVTIRCSRLASSMSTRTRTISSSKALRASSMTPPESRLESRVPSPCTLPACRLNALPQFHTDLDGVGIQFVPIRSPKSDAAPLILTHGWPGSVIEFLKVIPAMTDPSRHGGESQDAFHVVCPALPGYSFSDKPRQSGWSVEKIALACSELMLLLGNHRYA